MFNTKVLTDALRTIDTDPATWLQRVYGVGGADREVQPPPRPACGTAFCVVGHIAAQSMAGDEHLVWRWSDRQQSWDLVGVGDADCPIVTANEGGDVPYESIWYRAARVLGVDLDYAADQEDAYADLIDGNNSRADVQYYAEQLAGAAGVELDYEMPTTGREL